MQTLLDRHSKSATVRSCACCNTELPQNPCTLHAADATWAAGRQNQICHLTWPGLSWMIRFTGCSWFCFCFVLFVAVSSNQLPSCQQGRKQISLPSVSACHRFIRLLEDPQYCSLDQSQNCCVVLAAAVSNHCHCWKQLPKATYDLVNLLHQHCGRQHLTDNSQQLDIKVFIGVLTGANHAAQRQAGDVSYSYLMTYTRHCLHSF